MKFERKFAAPCLLAALPLLSACGTEAPIGEHFGTSEHSLTGPLTIHGRIASPTGAPISGVKVSLTGAATKSMTTGTDGAYSFTTLAAGAYTVTPSKTGLSFCTASASLPKLRVDAVEDFAGSSTGCTAATHTRNVTVVIYDPLITQSDGTQVKLSTYKNWEDPAQLVDRFKRSLQSITNGRVKYNVVKTKNISAFPVKADGFQYTQTSYLACLADSNQCHAADGVDMANILSTQGVCTDLNAGSTDETWVFGGPYFGFYESQLAGPGAFWYNSPPLDGTSCNKLLPIMGFNYERSLNEMVHDMIHRTESTMARVYGSWNENDISHNWNKFGLIAAQSPSYNYSGCGDAHWTPNSQQDYDYSNTRSIQTFCDDFFNYPNLKNPPSSALKTITCSAWGCDELAYYRYFFQHLPKASGTGPDTKFNDWWRYLVKPNDIVLTDPAVCSSEYAGGWCARVADGVHGTCNDGEWATASLPTGWAKLQFASKPVTSVTVYDRACDEQVTAGHLEFSDGSANISFGALENTGATGKKLTFAAKTLSWVKVVIDQSTGANPGIGEIVVQ
ncbi:MAG TPA: carboxypeptidase-like regulatory domain-containing protein [Polyangiaceae bacterium]|nr:carboxypeptidase-like regulatory domain-containing protein [Polyangiaceae bacterium]